MCSCKRSSCLKFFVFQNTLHFFLSENLYRVIMGFELEQQKAYRVPKYRDIEKYKIKIVKTNNQSVLCAV